MWTATTGFAGAQRIPSVVLYHNHRRTSLELLPGKLGWTVPGHGDGYNWVRVKFDDGPVWELHASDLIRFVPEHAVAGAADVVKRLKGTPYDADPVAAEKAHSAKLADWYCKTIDRTEMQVTGDGPNEVYAFTFDSLRRLAKLEEKQWYPMKVGYSEDSETGAMGRIASMCLDLAGFPEKILLQVVHRTTAGRGLEIAIHRHLRGEKRHIADAPGKEWFWTSADEIRELCAGLSPVMVQRKKKPFPRCCVD